MKNNIRFDFFHLPGLLLDSFRPVLRKKVSLLPLFSRDPDSGLSGFSNPAWPFVEGIGRNY
jgi:hypothetical protein